jgi:hypothetical protein
VLGIAFEVTAWLAAAVGLATCLGAVGPASLGLAVAGLTGVGVALRPERRFALWPGLAMCEAAWCVWLASAGVSAPEPYTVPLAAVAIAAGWRVSARRPATRSWVAYGPGLVLLLLPSLIAVWQAAAGSDVGWIRALLLGLVAAAIAVAGGRARSQAALVIGCAALLLDAGHALAPEVRGVVGWLPWWVPIALAGVLLLWAGATYEARLRNLSGLRRRLAAMR